MAGQLEDEKPRFLMFSSTSSPVQRCLELLRSRVFQRILAALAALAVFVGLLGTVMHVNPGGHFNDVKLPASIEEVVQPIYNSPERPTCKSIKNSGNVSLMEKATKKYEKLRDDKFTVAIQNYRREKALTRLLKNLLEGERVPSLLEVVVVWNDLENDPPADYKSSPHGIPVRYRKSKKNSLNSRLIPDPAFQTQAILLSDDDVYYQPLDLEFAFQSWRQYGRNRLTGAMSRCSYPDEEGRYTYTFCREGRDDHYNLMITNLAFSHMRFMDYYSSDDPIMTKIRAWVDEHMNCEDIAMNFVASLTTGEGPLLVYGETPFVSMNPSSGISKHKDHLEMRRVCINHFADLFGCMPLIDTQGHIGLGAGVHKWDALKAAAHPH